MAGILGAPSFTGNKSDEEKEQILYQFEYGMKLEKTDQENSVGGNSPDESHSEK